MPLPSSTTPDSPQGGGRDSERGIAGVAAFACALGLLVLTGPSLPIEHGWGLAIAVPILCVILAAGAAGRASPRGDEPRWLRALLAVLILLPAVLIAAVTARAASALLIAFPGVWWGLGALVVTGIVLAVPAIRGRGWLRALTVVIAAALVLVAAQRGAAYETDGPESVGFAHSGPIFGIHPYQTTAVIIDGYGPFDLPVNDFVDPNGERGYGPEALASALQTALRTIAAEHFADGPERARVAFAEATVTAVTTPPVRENLDREPTETEHHRLIIRSGSHGQRSRVEFRCPGIRPGPRPLEPDAVLEQQCADKYVTESSAGLGLTGRWSGYFEARGRERLGLAPWLGWTRSDDLEGRRAVAREQRYNAWNLLALLGIIGLALTERGRGRRVLSGISDIAAGIGLFACVGVLTLLALLLASNAGPTLPVVTSTAIPGAGDGLGSRTVAAWMPALVLLAVPGFARIRPRRAAAKSRLRERLVPRLMIGLPAVLVALASFALAGRLAALTWIRPELWFYRGLSAQGTVLDGRELALERFALALSDQLYAQLHASLGISLETAETLVATVLVVALVGVLAVFARVVPQWIGAGFATGSKDAPEEVGERIEVISRLLWLFGALAIVGSVSTLGGAALLPSALALAGLATSVARAPAGSPWLGLLAAAAWAAILALALLDVLALGSLRGFLVAMVALGFTAGGAGVAVAVWRCGGRRKDVESGR